MKIYIVGLFYWLKILMAYYCKIFSCKKYIPISAQFSIEKLYINFLEIFSRRIDFYIQESILDKKVCYNFC